MKKKKKKDVAAVGTWEMKILSFPAGFKEREFLCLKRTTAISSIYLKKLQHTILTCSVL